MKPDLGERSGRVALRTGTGLLVGLLLACLMVPFAAPKEVFDPLAQDMAEVLAPPNRSHWLGTDGLGRDVLARVLHGGRQSLGAAALATVLALALGASLGVFAASHRRWLSESLARLTDVINAFPALIGALVLLGAGIDVFTRWPAAWSVGVAVGLFSWPPLFRYVRAEALRWRESEWAESARAVGAPSLRIALRHLLPATLVPALIPAAFIAGGTILAEAGLGFIGFGSKPPAPTWGSLLLDAYRHVNEGAWWLMFFPGLALFLTVLGTHLIGEGLRRRLTHS